MLIRLAKKLFARLSAPRGPEPAWRVSCNSETINGVDPVGTMWSIRLDALAAIVIETNDTGPIGADVWWLLFGEDRTLAGAFPQEAAGADPLVKRLMSLPNFDHETMIVAMGSTGDATFPIWRKSA